MRISAANNIIKCHVRNLAGLVSAHNFALSLDHYEIYYVIGNGGFETTAYCHLNGIPTQEGNATNDNTHGILVIKILPGR